MVLALFITVTPTLVMLMIEQRRLLKSGLLRLSLAWFLGQAVFTILTYWVARALVLFTAGVLWKSSAVVLLLFLLALGYLYKRRHRVLLPVNMLPWPAVFAVLSAFFFSRQLAYHDGAIWIRAVYWDFPAQASLSQSFVWGDNFPPQVEFFAGAPLLYHFFIPLLTAIYAAVGLDLAAGFNFFSTLSFTALLCGITGLGEEFFASRAAGLIASLLTVTSSSLSFFDYLWQKRRLPWYELAAGIVKNPERPDLLALRPGQIAYNGSMFNMFYFVEERQLIAGGLFLILGAAVLYHRRRCSPFLCFLIGCLLGVFTQWHFYASVAFLAGLCFLIVFDDARARTLSMLAGCSLVFLASALLLRSAADSPLFLEGARHTPKFNFNFSNFSGGRFSPSNAFLSYSYAYGLKLFVLLGAMCFLYRRRQLFLVLLALILPAFAMANSIQLSASTIMENHKWLRLLNVFIDLAAAYGVVSLWKAGRLEKGLVVLLMAGLTASGVMELVPYVAAPPQRRLAAYPARFTTDVRANSRPQSVFLTRHIFETVLAGRQVYLDDPKKWPGNTMFFAGFLNRAPRIAARKAIYRASSLEEFCDAVNRERIDYVEFTASTKRLPIFSQLGSFPSWSTENEAGKPLTFVAAREGCRGH